MTNLSIVMAVFNGGSKVNEAIRSLLDQEYQDWDLVIVDDGSVDNTYQILQRFSHLDNRIKILRNPCNQGLAFSLNKGIEAAKTPYIARMDADDWAFPERIRIQMEFMVAHPEVDVLGAGAIDVDEKGRIIGTQLPREFHKGLVSRIFKENPFIHPTTMIRRHVYEELGGYNKAWLWAEDYDLWLRGYKLFRYHNLQVPLIYYHRSHSIRWSDALYTSRILFKIIQQNRMPLYLYWYALRPLLAKFLKRI